MCFRLIEQNLEIVPVVNKIDLTVTRVDGKPDFSAEKSGHRSRDDRSSGRSRRNPYGDKKKNSKEGRRKDREFDRKKGPKKDDKKPREETHAKSESDGFKRKPRKKTHADMPTPPNQKPN